MASPQNLVVLSPQVDLYPSPLHVSKKSRRTTLCRRLLRKSSYQSHCRSVYGPLDDIIDEITGNIWGTTFDFSSGFSRVGSESASEVLLTWQYPLKAPSTCTVTPLPVSRIPSDHPLTIRKNRKSRSTASGSSAGYPMPSSRESSRTTSAPADGPLVSSSAVDSSLPWPSFDESSHTPISETSSTVSILCTDYTLAQKTLEGIQHGDSDKQRTSRLRRFASSFTRLRGGGTGGDSNGSNVAAQKVPPTNMSRATDDEGNGQETSEAEAFMQKQARK
jgi:hypothetical protein